MGSDEAKVPLDVGSITITAQLEGSGSHNPGYIVSNWQIQIYLTAIGAIRQYGESHWRGAD